jgi:hypothetical protein
MLTNIIGTILAFVTIMLMLSLIVTSLVQFTQATLRLRGRNLLFGVSALIEQHHPSAAKISPAGDSTILRSRNSLKMAAHVLNDANASPLRQVAEPNAFHRVLLGPTVSWVEPADLACALVKTATERGAWVNTAMTHEAMVATASTQEVGEHDIAAQEVRSAPRPDEPTDLQQTVQANFQRMEPALAKRFQFIMRVWTVGWSFVIAIAFQVSTPDLLKSLPSSDARREAILASVPALVNDTKRQLASANGNIVDDSLAQLSLKYPQFHDLYDQVSGDADSKEVMLNELGAVLGAIPERDQVLQEYSRIIDSLSQQTAKTAIADVSKMLDSLETFGIGFWPQEHGYYFDATPAKWYQTPNWSRIFGVLITGILLSLGAPFWFEQLKNLASLRDTLNPNSSTSTPKSVPRQ